VRFIDEHKDDALPVRVGESELVFGVEPIRRVLSEHGCQIASSTYYATRKRPSSARAVRDEQLKVHSRRIFEDNYGVYEARKVWRQLAREGVEVGRCRVERLMRELGLAGGVRGATRRTTKADPAADRAPDLVNREFTATRPDQLWVIAFGGQVCDEPAGITDEQGHDLRAHGYARSPTSSTWLRSTSSPAHSTWWLG